MRRPILTSLILVTAVALALPALAGPEEATTVEKIPIAFPVPIPCANGGAGEIVDLTGTLLLTTRVVFKSDGSMHIQFQATPQGVTGIGRDTGDTYRGTGGTREGTHVRPGGFPFTTTFVNNFRIIGPGPGNNFTSHQTIHTTVNANGEVTSEVDLNVEDCHE